MPSISNHLQELSEIISAFSYMSLYFFAILTLPRVYFSLSSTCPFQSVSEFQRKGMVALDMPKHED